MAGLSGKHQYMPYPALGDAPGLLPDFLEREVLSRDGMLPGKRTICAHIFAQVGNIQGREQDNGPAEIPAGDLPRLFRHWFQKNVRSVRKKREKIEVGQFFPGQYGFDFLSGHSAKKAVEIKGFISFDNLIE